MSKIMNYVPIVGFVYLFYGTVLLLVALYLLMTSGGKENSTRNSAKVVYKSAKVALLIGHICLGVFAMFDSKIFPGLAFIVIGSVIYTIMTKAVPANFDFKVLNRK